ncbi:Cytochrome c mitochondrial import factor [Neofusicoccum parvum]|nr:Cytochrome c mitochondrial import factor [Neofusicoccum parvum]
MPRILHASLRPNAGVLLVLGGSAVGGFGYRYWASSKDDAAAAESSTLHPLRFSHYAIAAKQPVSSTSTLFTLRARDADAAATQNLQDTWTGGVWSVEAKQPQLQIARAYTPLPPTDADDADADTPAQFRFLIRRERGGEVSNYLHRLPDGAMVELRGPHAELALPEGVSEVLFLAGGTGIAPAMQVAAALQRRGTGGARMHILWANRRREDCLGGRSDTVAAEAGWKRWLGWGRAAGKTEGGAVDGEKGVVVRELEAMKRRAAPGQQLGVDYFVDEEESFIQPAHVARHLQDASRSEASRTPGSRLILISGPDGFLDYWAGRKVWAEQGEVQGPLRGALSKMDLKGWKVWKL